MKKEKRNIFRIFMEISKNWIFFKIMKLSIFKFSIKKRLYKLLVWIKRFFVLENIFYISFQNKKSFPFQIIQKKTNNFEIFSDIKIKFVFFCLFQIYRERKKYLIYFSFWNWFFL